MPYYPSYKISNAYATVSGQPGSGFDFNTFAKDNSILLMAVGGIGFLLRLLIPKLNVLGPLNYIIALGVMGIGVYGHYLKGGFGNTVKANYGALPYPTRYY